MKLPNPLTHHKPILTIKVKDIIVHSQIGKEWLIELVIVGFGIDKRRVRLGKQNTFILQTPWDTKSPSIVSAQIKAREKDKISDIFGPEEFDLEVNKTLPIENGHRKGQKAISFTILGQGGDAGKTAKATIVFEWFLSSNMEDIVSYIYDEMSKNLEVSEFIDLKRELAISNGLRIIDNYFLATVIDVPSIISKSSVYKKFRDLVGYGNQWDHKIPIYNICREWSLDAERGMLYRYDIFSNIHYGYIGRAAGFSVDELLDFAGLAQLLNEGSFTSITLPLRKLDDPIDQEAIKLGINIWERYKTRISAAIILEKIREKTQWKDGRKAADEGRNG